MSFNILSYPAYQPPASFLQEPSRYCEENNISWETTYHVGYLVATALVIGPLSAAYEKSEDKVSTLAENVGNAIASVNDAMVTKAVSAGTQLVNLGSWAANSVYGMLWGSGNEDKGQLAVPAAVNEDDGDYVHVDADQDPADPSYDFVDEGMMVSSLLTGFAGDDYVMVSH